MSQTLFTRRPLPCAASAARTFRQTISSSTSHISPRHAYHSSTGPKMSSGTAPLRNLFRQTTLRAAAIAAQRTSYPIAQQFHSTQLTQRRDRSPSPPPPYAVRGYTVLAARGEWTRFTPQGGYVMASVRTFSSSSRISWPEPAPSSTSPSTSLSPMSQKAVEEAIETITELYGTAKDEFEMAVEETEKNTSYAADDRAAAREELDRLLEFYEGVLDGEKAVAEEVKRRVGGRIRELENAVEGMEEGVIEGH